jgi:hypothetical protein
MGWSLSWAAIKGGTLETVCANMRVRPTGQREAEPESNTVGAQLPNGWYLVLLNRNTIEVQVLKDLSRSGEVVYCFVEDHVMFSTASGWEGGKAVWSVTHDCEKGRFHLETKGVVPAALEGIQSTLVAQQNSAGGEKADVDYIYDIPAELAKSLTGFRHDEDVPGMSGEVFFVLEPAEEARGFFGRLFGKKGRS